MHKHAQTRILEALRACWSADTSTKWTATTPALGQCSPTALVIQEFFGGRICKTEVGQLWHFYNEIDGHILDFTAEQFEGEISYQNVPAALCEVLADCTVEQRSALRAKFLQIYMRTGS